MFNLMIKKKVNWIESKLKVSSLFTELDLEFLLWCRNSNVIPNFFSFCLSSQSLKASLTYRQCQLKLLQEENRHKKFDIRVLKKEFNSSHSSLQHQIDFIDFAHVSSLFLRSNNRILASRLAKRWVN